MSKTRRGERTEEGPNPEAGETDTMSMASMMGMLQEERQARQEGQRMMMEQQRMLQTLLEKQQEERTQHRQEIETLLKKSESEPVTAKVKLSKPTLQKLAPQDNVEHFLATFERVATQQGWPRTCGLPSWQAC